MATPVINPFTSASRRLRLLATCSGLAIAGAVAAPVQAAPSLTGDATYTLDGGAPTANPQSDPVFFDIFPSASTTGSSIFGHTYAYADGNFGTRGSGSGVFDITSFTRYQNSFTNGTAAAAHYYASFIIQDGEVSAMMSGALTGTTYGGVTASILVNGAPVFEAAASMTVTDGGTAVFASSGTALNPGGESVGTGGGSYYWGAYSGVLDLGVLLPGASVDIDYTLTSHAYSTVTGCTSAYGGDPGYGGAAMLTVGLNAGVEIPGYGGTDCYSQTALARIGDPVDYQSQPGLFTVEAPEPASTALLGVGLAGLAFARRRARR